MKFKSYYYIDVLTEDVFVKSLNDVLKYIEHYLKTLIFFDNKELIKKYGKKYQDNPIDKVHIVKNSVIFNMDGIGQDIKLSIIPNKDDGFFDVIVHFTKTLVLSNTDKTNKFKNDILKTASDLGTYEMSFNGLTNLKFDFENMFKDLQFIQKTVLLKYDKQNIQDLKYA